MKNICTLVLLVLLVMMSCSKDDEVTPDPEIDGNDSITYFTLNVNEYWLNDYYKSGFIVINNDEGKLIDFKKIENNTKYVFKAKKDEAMDKFTVTRFIESGDGSDYKTADTFYNVKQGAEWNFWGGAPITNPGTPPNNISFDFKLENIEGWSDYSIVNATHSGTETSSSLDFSVSIEEDGVFMITVHFPSETSKYFILNNIKDSDIITLNKGDLLDFDSYININLPNDGNIYTKTLLADYNETERFLPYLELEMTPSITDNTLGLLDEFSYYRMQIRTSDSEKNFDYLYSYFSRSPKDINIPNLDLDFSVVNNTFDGFKIGTNSSYDIKTSQWVHYVTPDFNEINSWSFHSNEQDYNKVPELPIDLLNVHPNFEVEKLEYQRTILRKGGIAYSDLFVNIENTNNGEDIITESFTFNNPDTRNKMSRINDLDDMYDRLSPWE